MSEQTQPDPEVTDADEVGSSGVQEVLHEDDPELGRTSDPDGATRDEPAGEDYAGSGF